jgi:hypothetical protein
MSKILTLLTDPAHPSVYNKANTPFEIATAIDHSKLVAIYFGTHLTKGFTEALTEAYTEANCTTESSVTVIYVGSENNFQNFKSHVQLMPWLVYPFGSE